MANTVALNQAKKGMLAAGAQGGKGAADAYSQAVNNVGDMRQQALNDAAARSGALNAPQAFIDKQAQLAGMPGNVALPLIQALQSGNAGARSALQGAVGNYAASVGRSRALLANQAAQSNDNPLLHLEAADKAASLYQKLLRQANGGVSPSEQRAEQQFEWAKQAQQEKMDNRYAAQQQKQLEQQWSRSTDPLDQTVFGLASQYDTFGEALSALQTDSQFKKLYKKLSPDQRNSINDKLQSYYDPVSWRSSNVGPVGPAPIDTGR